MARKPNIVFIFADDWGWGDLSCHGHPKIKTPVLDKMAAEGTDFHDFNVNNPVCSPSRTAVLTGQYPARHGVHQHFASHELNFQRGMPDWLDPDVTTLPRILKSAGYQTAHYGKWHLTSRTIPGAPPPQEYGYNDSAVFNGHGKQIWEGLTKPEEAAMFPNAYLTTGAVEHALHFIEQNKDRPFFINLWIHETHAVVEATPAQKQVYADDSEVKEPELTYYAAVTKADFQIGRILKKIQDAGLDEDTLVIFSSDNGPEVPNDSPDMITHYSRGSTGGLRGRKRSLYDGGVRVPFIARWPGKIPEGVVNRTSTITGVDLLPTFCEVAGVPLPEQYQPDGESMLEALHGHEIIRTKPVFWEWRGPSSGDNCPRLGVRDREWKLIMNYDGSRIELYHKEDWEQKNNAVAAKPDIAGRLSGLALEWKASLSR